MRTLFLAFFIAVSLANHDRATAQTTTSVLRAGEHREFTRLVMSVPESVSWRIEKDGERIDLIIDDATLAIDVSQTFERIPRTRLRAVEAMATGVRLFLACPCPVRQVEGFTGQIVLDILSPPLPVASADRPLGPRPRPRPKDWSSADRGPIPANPVAIRAGTALAQAMRGTVPAPHDPSTLSPRLVGPDAPWQPRTEVANERPASEGAQGLATAVANAISAAASRAILLADPGFETQAAPAPTLEIAASAHLRLQGSDPAPSDATEASHCAQAASASVSDWSTPSTLSSQNMDWAALYTPLEQIDPEIAHELAAQFLRMGFGAEARAVLNLIPDPPPVKALVELTYLLDLERPNTGDPLLAAAHCSDLDMLWAFLAAPDEAIKVTGATDKIIRATQSLSAPMRSHLGPTIVNTLLRQDATEAAQLVQTAFNRSLAAVTTEARSSVTDIALDTALDATHVAKNDVADMSVTDLLLLFETAEQRELDLSEQVLEHAAARQFELRRSPAGRAMAEAVARAFGRAGAFRQAFDMALSTDADLDDVTKDALLGHLLQKLESEANDRDFVTLVFENLAWIDSSAPEPVRQSTASRLASLGFAQQSALLHGSVAGAMAGAPRTDTISSFQPGVSGTNDAGFEMDNETISRPPTSVAQVLPTTSPAMPLRSIAPPANGMTSANEDRSEADATSVASGLLAQGRASLREAADLRTQVESLLDGNTVP